jgi:hypothetical protein
MRIWWRTYKNPNSPKHFLTELRWGISFDPTEAEKFFQKVGYKHFRMHFCLRPHKKIESSVIQCPNKESFAVLLPGHAYTQESPISSWVMDKGCVRCPLGVKWCRCSNPIEILLVRPFPSDTANIARYLFYEDAMFVPEKSVLEYIKAIKDFLNILGNIALDIIYEKTTNAKDELELEEEE